MKNKIIDYLFENADPSIVLRVKKEILNRITEAEESKLLERILNQKSIQDLLRNRRPDGWLGSEFHGQRGGGTDDNMEVGLRFLAEKGLPPENEYIAKAVGSFFSSDPFFGEYRKKAPSDDYSNAAYSIFLLRSSVILRADYEYLLPQNEYIDLKRDVEFSFNTFAGVLNYKDADEAVETGRRKLRFKPGVQWPCSYDLRMLAHSRGWRSEENYSLLAAALNRLFSFQHDAKKMIYTYIKGQYRSPCLAFIHCQMYCLGLMDEDYINFNLLELFARCGIVKRVAFLKNKYEYMLSMLNGDLTVKYKPGPRERIWGPYGGFALEEDWKTKTRKQCDLLFRILMIMHHAEEGNGCV